MRHRCALKNPSKGDVQSWDLRSSTVGCTRDVAVVVVVFVAL